MLLWELIEREEAERERGRIRGRIRGKIITGHEESISTHIHGTNSRVLFLCCGLFYLTLLDGLCVKKHLVSMQFAAKHCPGRFQGCEACAWSPPRLLSSKYSNTTTPEYCSVEYG